MIIHHHDKNTRTLASLRLLIIVIIKCGLLFKVTVGNCAVQMTTIYHDKELRRKSGVIHVELVSLHTITLCVVVPV